MKVLIFSDIHGDTRALEKLVAQPADIYIANGDLSTFGKDLNRSAKKFGCFPEIMKATTTRARFASGSASSIFIARCAL
jgi:predicted phosphodiesterase